MNVRTLLSLSVLALLFLVAPSATAADKDGVRVRDGKWGEERLYKDLVRFNAGYSTNRHALFEVTYHHFLNRYAGVGGGVSCGMNYLGKNMPNGALADSDHEEWRMILDEDDDLRLDVTGPKFLLSGIFRSPFLVDSRKVRLSCLLEPGVVFAVPYSRREVLLSGGTGEDATEYVSAWGGRWLFWQFRGTLLASFRDFGIGLGYSLNDIDMYSTVRTLSYAGTDFRDFYPRRKHLYHTFALTVSYSF